MKQPSWVACGVVLGFTLQLSTNVVAAPRVWTSANGNFTIKAELIDYSDEDVRLKNEDGSTVTVAKEHLSETDWEFARNSPLSIYRLDGVLQVRNPRVNMGWTMLLRHENEFGQNTILKSGGDGPEAYVQIYAQELSEDMIPSSIGDQYMFCMGITANTVRTLGAAGLVARDFVPPDPPVDDQIRPIIFSTTMIREEDAAKIEFRQQTIFGKRHCFNLTVMAPNAKEADKLLQVIETIKELEETDDKTVEE